MYYLSIIDIAVLFFFNVIDFLEYASLAMSLLLKCSCKALFQLKEDLDRHLRDHPRCHQIFKSSKKKYDAHLFQLYIIYSWRSHLFCY